MVAEATAPRRGNVPRHILFYILSFPSRLEQIDFTADAVGEVGAYFGEQIELSFANFHRRLGELPADGVREASFFRIRQRTVTGARLGLVVGFLKDGALHSPTGITHARIAGHGGFLRIVAV